MKKIISLILIAVFCMGLFSCMPNLKRFVVGYGADAPELTDEILNDPAFLKFINKVNKFAINMTESVADSEKDENFSIASPALIMSLAVACESASGETREEILTALGVTYDELKAYIGYYYALCNTDFEYVDDAGHSNTYAHEILASSVWISEGNRYTAEGVRSLNEAFNCDVYSISFSNGNAKTLINQYVKYKSHNAIKENIDISRSSVLAIASAYHLSELWNGLDKSLTITLENYDFTNTDGSVVKKQLLKSEYTGGVTYNAGKYTSFYIETVDGYKLHFILPSPANSLKEVFTPSTISKVLSIKDYHHIDDASKEINYTRVIFPELNVSFDEDISPYLEKDFGIKKLFNADKCELGGLLGGKAHLASLAHQSALRVDAKGIEGSPIPLPHFQKDETEIDGYTKIYHDYVINRAFGFVLEDPDGIILYIGEVNQLKK